MIKAGYCSANINPDLGIALQGYFVPRYAKGILDDIIVQALVLDNSRKRILILSIDNNFIVTDKLKEIKSVIQKETGILEDNIFASVTHTHTAPCASKYGYFEEDVSLSDAYFKLLCERTVEAVKGALNSLKNAKIGYGTVKAPDRIAYIRRYKMKDGSICTCPPVNDSNIDYPLGKLDQRVNVIRIDRENGKSVVIMNYGLHADTTNGELISADWVGWVRKTVSLTLNGTETICIMGAEGDVGSTNVFPSASDMNDTEISFDNEMKSPGMARFVGRALAGSILQIFDKVTYIDTNDIDIVKYKFNAKLNIPKKEEIPLAKKYKKLHEAGRDCDIPYTGMELTTVVGESIRICQMENSPLYREIELIGLKIGKICLVGIPGEPFTEIGVKIKKIKGWDIVLPCALTNGYEGYFPSVSAFSEGGYEARTSVFKPQISRDIIKYSKQMLNLLKGEV